MTGRIVCFGEVLLRLSAPGRQLLLQTPSLEVCVAGAEANVAVSLARLGSPSAVVTVLPDNPLGRAARDELRRHGVDVSAVAWGKGRMGLYWLSQGAVLRPSEVTYDRDGSAFACAAPDAVDWDAILHSAQRLHLSGVTPAIGPGGAAASLRAAEAAVAAGVPVSFDGNYRAKLWQAWGGDRSGILRQLFASCDIAFADARDIALVLQQEFEGGYDQQLAAAAAAAFEAFPRLQIVACTKRVQSSVQRHDLSATMVRRDGRLTAGPYGLEGVVDRIGAGDAFAAGLLHALGRGDADGRALDFALAAAALKHSVPGDFNLVAEADIDQLLDHPDLAVRR